LTEFSQKTIIPLALIREISVEPSAERLAARVKTKTRTGGLTPAARPSILRAYGWL
jgi:hypothetical protein